jgi:hypothetical protein
MREPVIAILIFVLSAGYGGAQTPAAYDVASRATIRHGADSATLEANSPRPLQQAVDALVKEYGWIVDYEDPPYFSRRDAVDATAASWRAEHPNTRGVTRINGGPFRARYAEDTDPNDAAREERVLATIVSDYNFSGNPGTFVVQREGPGRFSIVGTSVRDDAGVATERSRILDIPVSIPARERTAYVALREVLAAVQARSGTTISAGLVPLNLLTHSSVIVGGQHIPARAMLQQIIAETGTRLRWELLYDPDGKAYFFNLVP